MKTWKLLICTILILLSVLPAQAQDDTPLHVVATTTQIGDLARLIGGDRIEVTQLMGGGTDPHLYRFTEADITAIGEADVLIYSGLHLEGRIDDVFEANRSQTPAYAIAEPIDRQGYTLPSADDLSTPDPHIWFDPRNWQLAAEEMVSILSQHDPENADFYAENGEIFIQQLDDLYAWGVEAMALVPESQRVLITSHDAFQYFGDAFGWEVRGLQGISTEDEAGIGDIDGLVDFIVEQAIPTVFVESSVPPNTIEAVQNGAQARGWNITIGGELYSDAMGTIGTYGGTYTGMIVENITTVVTAFGYGDQLPPLPDSLPQPDDFEDGDA